MQSKVVVTYEIDDLEQGAQELVDGLAEQFPLQKNSCGLLFCFSDMDIQEMARLVSERVPFDVIGCSCIANMDERDGFHDAAVTLTVLTADDCEFAAVASGPLTQESLYGEVEALFDRGRSMLGGEPALALILPPYLRNIMLDSYTDAFNTVAPNVPVCGGLPSYHAESTRNLTIFNDQLHEDRMVGVFIRGEIKPVVVIEKVKSRGTERKRTVTHSQDNIIYRVGSQTFVEYLQELGIPVDSILAGNILVSFVSNPLLLENVTINGQGNYSFVRSLHTINLEDGSGVAVGAIPEKATVSVCSLQGTHVEEAAGEGMQRLKNLMQAAPDYHYSTVLAFSCIGRYLVMVPNNRAEVDALVSTMPQGLTLNGFYTSGEVGPSQGPGGHMVNFAHNQSLVLCAF